MLFLPLIVLSIFLSTPSFAQNKPATKPPLGTTVTQFADWAVFTGTTTKGKVCYAASAPKTRMPKDLKRDPAFIMIATRPTEKIFHEFFIQTGFGMKADVDATLSVTGVDFPLFTKGEGAWVKLQSDEAKILNALKAGQNFTFKAKSMRGNDLSDTYSLAGLTQALEKVMLECK